ncbi:hypothetical protein DIS24_g8652 [Lasiodiplodia hormozganensis]|uniref:Uncharacterized protein n=1 Tax=Lasiodiplodia hormozganensis TaxID=869390 RepID=A0AA40CLE6_9PEZI|nr:hypothetical protein DIS24_g8652 [Lasiodiplodia hormozganensis]
MANAAALAPHPSGKDVAPSHLSAAYESTRLKGGIDAFERVARRTTTWSVLKLSTAHAILPAFIPAPPAPSATSPDTTSPLPLAFRLPTRCFRRSRTHLPHLCRHMSRPTSVTFTTTLDTIFHALHLIIITSSAM